MNDSMITACLLTFALVVACAAVANADTPKPAGLSRKMTVQKKYLIIPIRNNARNKCTLTLKVAGKAVRQYGLGLATSADDASFWAYFTIEGYKGQDAEVVATGAPKEGFDLIRQSDDIPGADKFYTESLRPQLRFSQKVGWNNDTNGMVHDGGEWHVYFQHNPVGWKWGNMTWGHAVSTDLVHWKQLPNVLFPSTMAKGACFSGSAAMDPNNTSGFRTGSEPVMVAALTDTGAGEAIAYSNDRGRSFTWYAKNPVVKHNGRDPRIFWYEPGKHWVMAVFDQSKANGRNIAFYTSKDLKDWTVQSHLPGYFECPEIFELPVSGTNGERRWVIFAADARYAVGTFDGKTFTPEHKGKYRLHYGAYYASQTFSDAPNGRRVQIGWARIAMPSMPFNQAFSLPCDLTLRKTPAGVRMFAEPVKELASLRKKTHTVGAAELTANSPKSVAVSGELFDIEARFDVGQAKAVGLDIGGNRVVYHVGARKLGEAAMVPVDGKVTIRVIVDRPIIEVCGNDGEVWITSARAKRGDVSAIKAFTEGGPARLVGMEVHELNSIWKK